MNYKNLLIIFFFIFLTSCEQYSSNKIIINQEIPNKYKNSGFALIYKDILKNEKLISKKIDNRSLLIFHKNLKKNSFVKITNPKKIQQISRSIDKKSRLGLLSIIYCKTPSLSGNPATLTGSL